LCCFRRALFCEQAGVAVQQKGVIKPLAAHCPRPSSRWLHSQARISMSSRWARGGEGASNPEAAKRNSVLNAIAPGSSQLQYFSPPSLLSARRRGARLRSCRVPKLQNIPPSPFFYFSVGDIIGLHIRPLFLYPFPQNSPASPVPPSISYYSSPDFSSVVCIRPANRAVINSWPISRVATGDRGELCGTVDMIVQGVQVMGGNSGERDKRGGVFWRFPLP